MSTKPGHFMADNSMRNLCDALLRGTWTQGNYSTNEVGTIRHPVAAYYCDTHPLFSEFAEDAV